MNRNTYVASLIDEFVIDNKEILCHALIKKLEVLTQQIDNEVLKIESYKES